MKNDTAEKWLLLQQSGELNALQRWLLERHLRAHPESRSFQEDLLAITQAVSAGRPDPTLRPAILEAIRRAAREEKSRRVEIVFQPHARAVPLLRPALALAALLLVLGTTHVLHRPRPAQIAQTKPPATAPSPEVARPAGTSAALAWDDNFDQQLSELSSLVAVSGTEWDETVSGTSSEADSVARELLDLGGT